MLGVLKMLDGLMPQYLVDLLHSVPAYTAIKWGLLLFISLAILALLTVEHKRMHRYYQRLAAHATSHDSAALDYSLHLLNVSTRNKIFFALSFIVLTLSVVFYDLKQQHYERMNAMERIDAQSDRSKCIEASEDVTALKPIQALAMPAETVNAQPAIISGEEYEKTLDSIKRDYEQLYINYYILKQCDRINPEAISQIDGALKTQLMQFDAWSESFVSNLKTASYTTWTELYKNTDCTSNHVSITSKRFAEYLSSLED